MRYLSVCSGIEAATVAWHGLGWEPAAFSEIEAFPRAVLAHHYPEVPLHGDFTTIRADEYGPVQLLVGGTPCQSFSVAGLRKGLDDPRGNLALGYLALAERLGAEWLVWENVPGVLSSNGGRDFGAFLGGLGQLGYGFAYRVLDAQFFGVPQRRRRVFVVARSGDWRSAAAVLFERESLCGHPAPRREAGAGVAGAITTGASAGGGWRIGPDEAAAQHIVPHVAQTLRARAGAKGVDSDCTDTLVPVAYGGNDTRGPIDVATALNACGTASGRQDFEAETFVCHGTQNPDVLDNLAHPLGRNQGQENAVCVTDHTTHALTSEGHDASEDGTGRGTPVVALSCKDHGADVGETAPTLRAMGHGGSHPNAGGQVAVAQGMAVRRLTPRECERLQGFPDDYTRIPWRNKGADDCPDGPRYKALGNSMAVPVMAWIGRRIDAVNALEVAHG